MIDKKFYVNITSPLWNPFYLWGYLFDHFMTNYFNVHFEITEEAS
jgi:hypothetical protein